MKRSKGYDKYVLCIYKFSTVLHFNIAKLLLFRLKIYKAIVLHT